MPLSFIGAIVGLLFGGTRGLLLGALFGYGIGWVLRAKLGTEAGIRADGRKLCAHECAHSLII